MKAESSEQSLAFADMIAAVLMILTPALHSDLAGHIDPKSVGQILAAREKSALFDQAAWQDCQAASCAFNQAQAAWQKNRASFVLWCAYIAALGSYRAALVNRHKEMQLVAPDYVSLNAHDPSFEQLGPFFSGLKDALRQENSRLAEQKESAGQWAAMQIQSWAEADDSAAGLGLFKEVSDQPLDWLRTLLNQIDQLWLGSSQKSLNQIAAFAYVSHVIAGQFRFQHGGQDFNLSIPGQSAWLPWLFAGYQARYQLFYNQVALVYLKIALAGNPLSKKRQEAVSTLGAKIKTVRATLCSWWLFQYETCRALDALTLQIDEVLSGQRGPAVNAL